MEMLKLKANETGSVSMEIILICLESPLSVSETMRSGSRLPQHPCLRHVQTVPFLLLAASFSLNVGVMAASSSGVPLILFFRTVDANFITVSDSPAESVSLVLKVAQPARIPLFPPASFSSHSPAHS